MHGGDRSALDPGSPLTYSPQLAMMAPAEEANGLPLNGGHCSSVAGWPAQPKLLPTVIICEFPPSDPLRAVVGSLPECCSRLLLPSSFLASFPVPPPPRHSFSAAKPLRTAWQSGQRPAMLQGEEDGLAAPATAATNLRRRRLQGRQQSGAATIAALFSIAASAWRADPQILWSTLAPQFAKAFGSISVCASLPC